MGYYVKMDRIKVEYGIWDYERDKLINDESVIQANLNTTQNYRECWEFEPRSVVEH
jgi:hypothetical protein